MAPQVSNADAAYVAEREAAQKRRIDLSMARKAGYLPSGDPKDQALLDATPKQAERGFDPRKW